MEVDTTKGITTAVLDNGLTAIIKEAHAAPVVALNAWVNVGSTNEPAQLSGVSHFIEHMLFKGTRRRKAGEVADEIESLGGVLNAGTSYNYTMYYQVVSSRFFSRILDVQADVIMNSGFDAEEFERERKVVIEESRMLDDDPDALSWYKLLELAFKKHRYRRPIVGCEETLESLSRDDLYDYYHRYYRPKNMTLVVVGDIDTRTALEDIDAAYTGWNPGEVELDISAQEPPQESFRYDEMYGDIESVYLKMAYHTPPLGNDTTYPLEIISDLLGRGRSSRLYERLKIKENLVTDVSAELFAEKDEGLLTIGATIPRRADVEKVERAILEEIERFRYQYPSGREIDKSRNFLERQYITEQERVEGVARKLGYFQLVAGDFKFAEEYVSRLYAVTQEDIRKTAREELQFNDLSMLVYAPREIGKKLSGAISEFRESLEESPPQSTASAAKFAGVQAGLEASSGEPAKVVLDNGVTVLVKENHLVPSVSVCIGFRECMSEENESTSGITYLTHSMMSRGTKNRTRAEIIGDIENLGANLGAMTSRSIAGWRTSTISRGYPQVLSVMADIAKNPVFPKNEFEGARSDVISRIRKRYDQSVAVGVDLCLKGLYPDHFYGLPVLGAVESLGMITLEDVESWYKRRFAGSSLIVGIVGDISGKEAIETASELFGGIPEGEKNIPPPVVPLEESIAATEKKEKKQSVIVVGFQGPPGTGREGIVMETVASTLGRMGGRLFRELRDRQGLAYIAAALYTPSSLSGAVLGILAPSPGNEGKSAKALIHQFEKLREKGLSETELDSAKKHVIGTIEIGLQSNSSQAATYVMKEAIGAGYDSVDKLGDEIASVTTEEAMGVIESYIDTSRHSLAIVTSGNQV
jgi:zinc protease